MAEVQRGGGLFGGLFGGGQQEPQDGNETSTDPFENLSRSQRTMLGFAALRDAAASLEGRDSQYFQGALGGFEQGRERERLRAQGIQQNQVGALQALAQVEQQIALSQAYGVAPSPAALQMRDMLMQSVGGGGGMAAPTQVQSPMPTQAPVTGVAPPAPVTTSPIPPQGGGFDPTQVQIGGEPAPAPAPAAAPVDPMAALDAREAELLQRANAITAAGGDTGPIQMELRQLEGQRERLAAEGAAASEATQATQSAADRAEQVVLPEVEGAMDFLVSGFDENGNPVFNPFLTTRAGRLSQEVTQNADYQAFTGALETLKVDTLIDALSQVTAGALSDAEREAFSALQGQLDPANPQGTYRALQRMQRIANDAIARAGQTTSAPSNTPQVNWD